MLGPWRPNTYEIRFANIAVVESLVATKTPTELTEVRDLGPLPMLLPKASMLTSSIRRCYASIGPASAGGMHKKDGSKTAASSMKEPCCSWPARMQSVPAKSDAKKDYWQCAAAGNRSATPVHVIAPGAETSADAAHTLEWEALCCPLASGASTPTCGATLPSKDEHLKSSRTYESGICMLVRN